MHRRERPTTRATTAYLRVRICECGLGILSSFRAAYTTRRRHARDICMLRRRLNIAASCLRERRQTERRDGCVTSENALAFAFAFLRDGFATPVSTACEIESFPCYFTIVHDRCNRWSREVAASRNRKWSWFPEIRVKSAAF